MCIYDTYMSMCIYIYHIYIYIYHIYIYIDIYIYSVYIENVSYRVCRVSKGQQAEERPKLDDSPHTFWNPNRSTRRVHVPNPEP